MQKLSLIDRWREDPDGFIIINGNEKDGSTNNSLDNNSIAGGFDSNIGGGQVQVNGGKGSGNWGHAGRPGEVGGSAPQGSTSASWRDLPDDAETLEFDSIEKVYLEDRGGWSAYKKKLYDKYSALHPDKKIVVRRTRMQTPGLLEYAVFGLKKDDEEDSNESKNSLELNGGKGSGNFGHSGRPGLVGGSAPAGTSPAVAIYVTGEEAKMDFDTILQRRDLQQKLKRMRKIDDFNDDVVAEMKKLQFTDEEIERWRAMILAKEVVHIMDRDKRREKRAQISDSVEQKEAIEKVVSSVEMEDKDKTWLRNNCDVEMAQALSREIDRAKESGIEKIRLNLNDSKSINGRMGYIAGRDEYELTLRKGLLRDTEQTKASRERQGPNGRRYKSSDDIGGTFAHEFGHALETVFAKSLVGDRGIAKSSMHMSEITSFTSRAIVEQAKRNIIAKGIGKEELFRNADNKYMSAYGRTNIREAIAESHANPNFSEFTREIENIVTRKVPIDKDLLDPILNRINFREKQYQEFLHGKD